MFFRYYDPLYCFFLFLFKLPTIHALIRFIKETFVFDYKDNVLKKLLLQNDVTIIMIL